MQIELKYGRWQTKEGIQWKDLNQVDKCLFDVLIGVEKITVKYNLKYNEKNNHRIFYALKRYFLLPE